MFTAQALMKPTLVLTLLLHRARCVFQDQSKYWTSHTSRANSLILSARQLKSAMKSPNVAGKRLLLSRPVTRCTWHTKNSVTWLWTVWVVTAWLFTCCSANWRKAISLPRFVMPLSVKWLNCISRPTVQWWQDTASTCYTPDRRKLFCMPYSARTWGQRILSSAVTTLAWAITMVRLMHRQYLITKCLPAH